MTALLRRGGAPLRWILGVALAIATTAWAAQASGWGKYGRLHAAWRSAAQVSGLCGIGLYRTLPLVASQALLARDVPLYQFDDDAAVRRSHAFDVLVTSYAHRDDLSGYQAVSCSGRRPRDLCVRARPGGCVAESDDARFAVNRFLERVNFRSGFDPSQPRRALSQQSAPEVSPSSVAAMLAFRFWGEDSTACERSAGSA